MQEFPGLPENIYEYENRFNYSVWTPNTKVVLCSVPWDSSYRDVVRFDTDADRFAWFNNRESEGLGIVLNGMVYLKYGEPIRINVPFDQAAKYNYIVVTNPMQPVPGSTTPSQLYYFVNEVRYVAPNTTELLIQLDVWQTFYTRVNFNLCYVNKGHIGIANTHASISSLNRYMLEPEGLNAGDEYEIVHQEYFNFYNMPPWVLFMSSADLTGDWGTEANPNLATANGTSGGGVTQGCELYVCDFQNFRLLMGQLSAAPWVSQCISYVTLIPANMVKLGSKITYKNVEFYELALSPNNELTYSVTGFYDKFALPARYANLLKFYTAPYSCVEITYNNGGEIVLKPECVGLEDTPTQQVDFVLLSATVPPDIRAIFFPKHYNNAGITDVSETSKNGAGAEVTRTFYNGEGYDMALTMTNFPQVSIVNNMYSYYLASSVHTRDYQFASADWSQQKALTAAQLGYSQASNAMDTALLNQQRSNQLSRALTNQANTQAWANTGLNAVTGIVGGAVGGGAAGLAAGAASAVANAAGTAINNSFNQLSTNTNIAAANDILANTQANQAFNRDTNYDYAKFATQGDYETAIQGIQAKVQDARLTQPTTSGQNGGDLFNIANGLCGVLVKWKRIKPNFINQIGDFWLRYGYYINRWITPPADLKCMSNFTYWKMQETNLGSSKVPELFREAIRGIFEKGVTVWNDPEKIGKTDLADNAPLEGIYY
nr:MAG TPA: Major tail protein [Caudoviricetes sp.]